MCHAYEGEKAYLSARDQRRAAAAMECQSAIRGALKAARAVGVPRHHLSALLMEEARESDKLD